MRLHDLSSPPGARTERRRVGRGSGSGRGTYSGRGLKGQKARAGGGVAPYFEGGQLPMVKRMPNLRGFTNIFRLEHAEVNVGRLNGFAADGEVTPEAMEAAGIVKSAVGKPIKVLGDGELDRALTVQAHRFSKSAREKIEAAGGSAVELPAWRAPTKRADGFSRRGVGRGEA